MMRDQQWMAAAQRRRVTLTHPTGAAVAVAPAGRGWTVQTDGRPAITVDAVRLDHLMDQWAMQGYRETR